MLDEDDPRDSIEARFNDHIVGLSLGPDPDPVSVDE